MTKPKRTSHVNVIGAGFAGIECALFLARHGVYVHVFNTPSEVYKIDDVSFGMSDNNKTWKQRLRMEAKILGSKLVDLEQTLSEKGDEELAKKVLEYGHELLKQEKNIEVFDITITELNPKEINVVSTGPKTEEGLYKTLRDEFGARKCFSHYAVYPVVSDIEENLCKKRDLEDKNLYYPLNYQEYISLCNSIIIERNLHNSMVRSEKKDCEYECIERLVEKDKDALRHAFLQPIMLQGLSERPYAVVKMIKTEKGYILDGFCSQLPFDYQSRIIRSLAPLRNAKLLRSGKLTPHVYINAPMVINEFGQAEKRGNLFFAGNISGIFGQIESMLSGIYVGHNVLSFLNDKNMREMPQESCMGGIMRQLISQKVVKFVPITGNCDIMEEDIEDVKSKLIKYEEDFNARNV